MAGTFRSLRNPNYRMWAGGALVSNVGTWMQRIAQDWLVLTMLTPNSATAVGVVMALQFGPHLLLLPVTGLAADTLDRRKLLIFTQAAMGVMALGLGLLTLGGHIQLWQVYLFAFLLGCVTAFDSPARQTFVSELVGDEDLSNAVGLNSTSFHAARMIGPAIAGGLISAVGAGWVFLINALSFVAVLFALYSLKLEQLHRKPRVQARRASLGDGFRYVRARPDLMVVLLILFLISTFGLNFPIFISTMAVSVFHTGAGQFGFLSSLMAIGSVTGALLAAGRARPNLVLVTAAATIFGIASTAAAVMPSYLLFGLALAVIGVAAQTLTTSANSLMQLSTDPAMRGRVMAIFMAILFGSTPLGAPVVGWVIDHYGPRWGLGVAAAAGALATLVGLVYFVRFRKLRLFLEDGRLRLSFEPEAAAIVPSLVITPLAQAQGANKK